MSQPDRAEGVDEVLEILEHWGATDVVVRVGGRDGQPVDFHTPLPGDQPISSSVVIDDGKVAKATIRYGVLDDAHFDGHPTHSTPQTRRIVRAAGRVDAPIGPLILANYGDDHYPPRPHLLIGWKPSMADPIETVRKGEKHPLTPRRALDYIIRVGGEYLSEFSGEYV